MKKKRSGSTDARWLIGVGLIVFAVLLFLDNIGIRFLHIIIYNWPLVLIIIGAALLMAEKKSKMPNRAGRVLPYFLIGAGALFFAGRMFGFSIGALVVPLVLIFFGVHFLRPHGHSKKCRPQLKLGTHGELKEAEEELKEAGVAAAADDENKIDVFTILGGGDYNTRSQNLSGGNIAVVFGGADIDIRDADTQKDVIEIDILALFGGVDLKVPPHWQVTVKVLPLLGGVSNKTTCLADKMQVKKKHLIVTGNVLFGGLDIRN